MDEPMIINVADAPAISHPRRATAIEFEPGEAPWPDTGVNIQVMQPGQPVHCPAGCEHVFVGAGDGPSAVLMIGSRRVETAHYPVNEVAAKYGASATTTTDDPAEAYADWRQLPWQPTQNPWPLD